MAIEQGSETVAIVTEERTWKVEIFCEKNTDPLVRVHRQIVRSLPDGTIISTDNNATVERRQSQVGSETITIGNVTVTGDQLAALVSQVADQWRQQDVDAIAAQLAEMEAQPAPQEPEADPTPDAQEEQEQEA